jgi:hypothetical protein
MSDLQTEEHRTAWRVVVETIPGSEFISHRVELDDREMCSVKFPIVITLNPNGCPTCGESVDVVGLTTKCRDWHEVCRCGRRFDQPKAKECRRRKHVKEEK